MADRDLLLSLAGPLLASYLQDSLMTNLLCNDNGTCFVSRVGQGKQEQEHPGFPVLDRFLAAVAHEVGAEWRAEHPRMAAALDDIGWRIQAARPPATPAPFMALRKHPKHVWSLTDLVEQGVLTGEQSQVLTEAMKQRKRVLVVGGTGSAKTTLVNSLLQTLCDTSLRVVILEDAPEIQCTIRDCTRMWGIPGKYGMREMVQDGLRLFPSLIVVGEVRDGSALDLLKCWQTGHGGLGTVHVDEAEHAMLRLEQLVQEVSLSPQRELIGEVVDMIVAMKGGEEIGWKCQGIVALDGWNGSTYITRRIA